MHVRIATQSDAKDTSVEQVLVRDTCKCDSQTTGCTHVTVLFKTWCVH